MSASPNESPAADSALAETSDPSIPSHPEVDDPRAKARAELCQDLYSAGSIPQDVLTVLQSARFDVLDTAQVRLAPTPVFGRNSSQSAYVISFKVDWAVPGHVPSVSTKGVFCPAYSNLDEDPCRGSLKSISKIHAKIHAQSDGNPVDFSQLASEYCAFDPTQADQARWDRKLERRSWESRFGGLVVKLLEGEILDDMRGSGGQTTTADTICKVVHVPPEQYDAWMFTSKGEMDLSFTTVNMWSEVKEGPGDPGHFGTSYGLLRPRAGLKSFVAHFRVP